ncbi:MAG: hypothetical protein HC830_05985 [Bacteroidetes bacterium]|nr:hypothetical protein [Bacteroidota bacterium]
MKNIKLSINVLCLFLVMFSSCEKSFEYEPGPNLPNGKLNVNIIDFLKSRPDVFSILVQAIDRAGLTSTLVQAHIRYLRLKIPISKLI